jgi:hypothetical protein
VTLAERMALGTAALGLLHHVDHVFRYDHSGWPFKRDISPFTFSLLVYPLIMVLLGLRGWPRTRVGLSLVLFLFPTLSHVFLETPIDQYHSWTGRPDINLLHVSTPVLGFVAVIITVALSTAAFVTLIAFWREASV